MNPERSRSIFGWLLAALIAGIPAAACLADKKINVPPPPPPPADTKPAATFDYNHTVKKVNRDRKPVIALLRPGDVVQLAEYLPFGRGTAITTTRPDGTKRETIIKDGTEDAPVLMPGPIRQYLTRELLDTREFIVVERERILEIARELALAKTQAADPDTVARPGRIIGVHYILEGSYWASGGLPAGDPALDGVRREINRRRLNIDPSQACVMYLTVYKVETGEVKAVACGADLRPLVAVKKAVEDLVDQLGDIVEPIKVARVNPEKGLALLDIGADDNTKTGDVFTLAPAAAAGPAGATGPQEPAKEPVKAQVVKLQPLSCVVKLVSGAAASIKEGQEARRETPPAPAKDEKPAPAPAEKSGG
jgi:hypothetical protein